MPGGQPPQRDAQTDREEERGGSQLDGGRKLLDKFLEYRSIADRAGAEISLKETADVDQVLLVERLVEIEHRAQALNCGRCRVLPQDRPRGIAGKQVNEGEEHDRQAEQDGDRPEKPANGVLEHPPACLPRVKRPRGSN